MSNPQYSLTDNSRNTCYTILISIIGINDPPTPEYQTSCYEKQDNRYQSLQTAWEDCVKDSLCKGVYDSECDDKYWRLCYGDSKSSRNSCIYPRVLTPSQGKPILR